MCNDLSDMITIGGTTFTSSGSNTYLGALKNLISSVAGISVELTGKARAEADKAHAALVKAYDYHARSSDQT